MLEIITAIAALGKTYLDGRAVKIKARAEAEAEVMRLAAKSSADWEQIMAGNSGTSWKDEWLTILFSIPLIMAFFPSGVDFVIAGFAALDNTPSWYQYTLSVIVAASFGVRSAIGLMNAKKK